ncbi:V-ATPase V1 sector subunit E, partial [Coelomomyces lativittatus]
MTSRALNDEQAQNEMKKMIAFIKQEALEKAKEIKIKADEEFNIEKAKFVRQETANIDALFQKKIKQAEVQRKIAASNFYNKSKLRVLQLRDDLLNNLNQQSRRKLEAFTQQQEAYRGLMKQLLIQ